MNNDQIKKLLKDEHIYMWQIAKMLKIHETTFFRWFHEPLSKDKQMQILSAIESIKIQRLKEE